MALLLGIDIGTTGVRAGAFDERGTLLAEASEPCPRDEPAPGYVEADAETWWSAVRTVCGRLGERVPLAAVDAVGVTGQAPTAVVVDALGRPLRRAILWLDVRADAEARALEATLGPGRAESLGGNRMHPYYLGPKLAWLRAHEPDVLERAALVLQSHAFVALRLTGEAACDASTAMLCAPLFEARAGAWSAEGARAAGVSLRLLPRLARAHDVLGTVTRDAAAATGLREGTPVVAGGGDFAASALGAGVIEEGQACLMLGTAGNLLVPTRAPRFDSRLINSHHVGCERWLTLGGTLCGAALEWFRGAMAPGVAWEALEAEAASVEVGSEGLVVLPYLQGERTPVWNEHARGVFFGLRLAHRRGHLYRAMIEGVALGFRHCLAVAEEGGVRFDEVLASDGAGRSPLLRQALADALGLPLTWSSGGRGGTAAGAAILAGLGVGALPGAEAARGWRGAGVRHEPDPRAHARLGETFHRRLALYDAVRPVGSVGSAGR
ncbi:MAG TPA: FGGY family carbohydrate kinase [Polyangiaceae bacterium]|jgi:xylulokinase